MVAGLAHFVGLALLAETGRAHASAQQATSQWRRSIIEVTDTGALISAATSADMNSWRYFKDKRQGSSFLG